MANKTGTFSNGFNYEYDEAVMDDMELMDALAELGAGHPYAPSKVIGMILGAEQKRALYDHVRNDAGRVPIQAIISSLNELLAPEKN